MTDIIVRNPEEVMDNLAANKLAEWVIHNVSIAVTLDLKDNEDNRDYVASMLHALAHVITIVAVDVETGEEPFTKPEDSK